MFSGERYLTELGLYDLRYRYYSPGLGRFLQPDPIGFKGDASNLYRYCGNDWANKTDPMGLDVPSQHYPKWGSPERAVAGEDAQWAMAKWADRSNTFTGSFAAFMAMRGLSSGEGSSINQGKSQGKQGETKVTSPNDQAKAAAKDPKVAAAQNKAWSDSNPNAKEVWYTQPGSTKREQGLWVKKTSDGYGVVRVPAGTRSSMDVPAIMALKPEGAVYFFHAHPNTEKEGYNLGQRGMKDDTNFIKKTAKVPGLVRDKLGDHWIPYP